MNPVVIITLFAVVFLAWHLDRKRITKRAHSIGWNDGREYQIALTKPKRSSNGQFAAKETR